MCLCDIKRYVKATLSEYAVGNTNACTRITYSNHNSFIPFICNHNAYILYTIYIFILCIYTAILMLFVFSTQISENLFRQMH